MTTKTLKITHSQQNNSQQQDNLKPTPEAKQTSSFKAIFDCYIF